MTKITLHPGDTAVIAGTRLTVDRTVTLHASDGIQRIPAPGLADLPETGLRIRDLWRHRGHRVPMVTRQDLRCPCGSAYVRRSTTHHSCHYCQRVWENREVPGEGDDYLG
jgi:hypothetical protein